MGEGCPCKASSRMKVRVRAEFYCGIRDAKRRSAEARFAYG